MKINLNKEYQARPVLFQGKLANIKTDYLLELINSGKSVKAIRTELGIANDTYYKLLAERGIPFRKLKPLTTTSDNFKEQISELLSQGVSVTEICKKLNITSYKYYSIVKHSGLENPKVKKTKNAAKVTAKQLQKMIASGLSVKSVCETLGISENAYYSLLKKFGIQTQLKKATLHNASITKAQLLACLQAGKSMEDIIKELKITVSAYISLISKFGIVTEMKSLKQKVSSITKDQLQELIDENMSVNEICEKLDIPVRTYSRLLNKFGIITERKAAKVHLASVQKEHLQAAVDENLSIDDICMLFNINKGAFYKLLKRLSIQYDYLHHAGEINIPKGKLMELASSGKTVNEIADELGIASTTYHEKAKLAQVKTVLRDSIELVNSVSKETIQNLVNMGKSIDEICTELGISRKNYTTLLRKYNLQTIQRKSQAHISTIKKEQLLELRKCGKNIQEICTELNISKSTFRRIMAANSDDLC